MKANLVIFVFFTLFRAAIAPPTPPDHVVFKPTFLTGYDSLTAGTAFVIKIGTDHFGVTAHHLFGPAAGLEADLSPEQAKDFAAVLALSSMTNHTHVITTEKMILLPSAHAFSDDDASKDVAAFLLSNYSGPALVAASTTPKAGDPIYLLARPRGEQRLRIISGRVARISEKMIQYVYDQGGFNFAGTSGAPVLNESGEVVAINLGGGEFKGREFGFGNPATSFIGLISEALSSEANKSLQPTPTAVTPPAAQEIVPAVGVAEH
jgi:hypothetical protein